IDLPPKVIDRPLPGPTVFTDTSSTTSTVVWQEQGQWQCVKMKDQSLSVQLLEASAIVLACNLFQTSHLNIVTDSMCAAKLCQAMSHPGISNSPAASMIEEALHSRQGTVTVFHSHSPIKGYFQIGNDKADAAAKNLWNLQSAQQLHESLHIGAKALAKRCDIPMSDAKHIVATCPYCQK
ncbi:POL1 protein, partial [Regulus satrapa]|nr:POL1 protein [Regulus satrapa]